MRCAVFVICAVFFTYSCLTSCVAASARPDLYNMPTHKYDGNVAPTLFVYKHLSKTAGTLTSMVMRELNNATGGEGEFEFVKDERPLGDRRINDFVVGSIRNVCDWYLSMWMFSPHTACVRTPEGSHSGTCARSELFNQYGAFNSHHDFTTWLQASAPLPSPSIGWPNASLGYFSHVFWSNFLSPSSCFISRRRDAAHRFSNAAFNGSCWPPDAMHDLEAFSKIAGRPIHCWVRVENYEADFMHCLSMYEGLRNRHNNTHTYKSRGLQAVVQSSIERFASDSALHRGKEAGRRETLYNLTCAAHFRNRQALEAVARLDGTLLQMTGCCLPKMDEEDGADSVHQKNSKTSTPPTYNCTDLKQSITRRWVYRGASRAFSCGH